MRFTTLSSLVLLATAAAATDTVHLPNGLFKGRDDGITVSYLGIPYAAPPTHELRFKPPTKPHFKSGTNYADKYGPGCIQNAAHQTSHTHSESENCLSINVVSPVGKSNLPVIVFIHGGSTMGGAFDSGFSADPFYDARTLVEVNPHVVVVTFNYRLGVFGFLGGVDLAADGPLNPGLLDQVAAFEWVHDNIHLFGGNASRVTAMGHSAGATSIGVHLLAGRGNQTLFSRAILLSGGPGILYQTPQSFDPAYQFLLTSLGCSPGKSSVACLQRQPAEMLTKYTKNMEFFPIVDGNYVATQGLTSELVLNAVSRVPLLITNVLDEGTIPGAVLGIRTDDEANMYRKSYFPCLNTAEQDQLAVVFPNSEYPHGPYQKAGEFYADFIYRCPAKLLAEVNRKNKVDTYIGIFTSKPEYSEYHKRFAGYHLGVYHGSELPFIFQHKLSLGPKGKKVAKSTLAQIVNFASGYSPSTDWPASGTDGWIMDMQTRVTTYGTNISSKCDMLINYAQANFNCV